MSKVMKAIAYVKILIDIVAGVYGPQKYYGGSRWSEWFDGIWHFDCLVGPKSIWWGWKGDKNAAHGGAVYGSNGVYDDTEWALINRCKQVSFANMRPGTILYMWGHIGTYVGWRTINGVSGNVIEFTTDGLGKGQLTKVDAYGHRWVNGIQMRSWEKAGEVPYLDYDEVEPYTPHKTDEDGEWGFGFTQLLQYIFGTEIDGFVSNQDTDCWDYLMNCVPIGENLGAWEFNDSDGYSPLIKAIQKKIGMSVEKQDGKCGPETIRYLQIWLGFTGDDVDGECGPKTVTAFQKWANAQIE